MLVFCAFVSFGVVLFEFLDIIGGQSYEDDHSNTRDDKVKRLILEKHIDHSANNDPDEPHK
jgi:hypothetical protein